MARPSKQDGLVLRGGVWYIRKSIKGYGRLQESTGCSDREEAERYLHHRLIEIRNAVVYGVRPTHVWRQAATKYLLENRHMPSIQDTARFFEQLDPFIGGTALNMIHDGTLTRFVKARQADGVSNRTINIALQRVVRVLNLAAHTWRDEHGITWLDTPPKLTMLDERATQRGAYPLGWEEQRFFFKRLSDHLHRMALFKVNTGCREQEVCRLQWDWEVQIPELEATVFLIPWNFGGRRQNSGVKNKEDRLVVLNSVARSVIDGQRGLHPTWVFPFEGRAINKMNDTGWKAARRRTGRDWLEEKGEPAPVGLLRLRVHDLKHTFGRRLRAAGVSFEDRQVLLGHTNHSVTTHYSSADIGKLIEAANKVVFTETGSNLVHLTVLKRKAG